MTHEGHKMVYLEEGLRRLTPFTVRLDGDIEPVWSLSEVERTNDLRTGVTCLDCREPVDERAGLAPDWQVL